MIQTDTPSPAAQGGTKQVKKLLFSLLPGLFPLLVFIAVSEIWGDMAGVWVGTGLGVAEFLVILVAQRRVDAFVLVDTALLVGTGLVSVLLEDDIFFRFKPVILELILVAIIGVSAWGPRDMISAIAFKGSAGKQMQDTVNSNPTAKNYMQSMMRSLFWLLVAHTLLSVAAALWMSLEAWGFITGVLPILLMGLWLGIKFIQLKLAQRAMIKAHMNQPLPAPRKE